GARKTNLLLVRKSQSWEGPFDSCFRNHLNQGLSALEIGRFFKTPKNIPNTFLPAGATSFSFCVMANQLDLNRLKWVRRSLGYYLRQALIPRHRQERGRLISPTGFGITDRG